MVSFDIKDAVYILLPVNQEAAKTTVSRVILGLLGRPLKVKSCIKVKI